VAAIAETIETTAWCLPNVLRAATLGAGVVEQAVTIKATELLMQHDANRPEDVLKVDADDEGIGGDDAADTCRYLVATKGRE